MVSKSKKRIMITLSNQVLDLTDKLCADSGESYSELITRLLINECLRSKEV